MTWSVKAWEGAVRCPELRKLLSVYVEAMQESTDRHHQYVEALETGAATLRSGMRERLDQAAQRVRMTRANVQAHLDAHGCNY